MKISNDLVAYAVISSKLEEGENVFAAFVPFFSAVLNQAGTKTFTAQYISGGMERDFGIKIPALAVEGMIPS